MRETLIQDTPREPDEESAEFFMLYLAGDSAPAKKHTTITEAKMEAIRLAKKHNMRVYILRTVAHVEQSTPPLTYTEYDKPEFI